MSGEKLKSGEGGSLDDDVGGEVDPQRDDAPAATGGDDPERFSPRSKVVCRRHVDGVTIRVPALGVIEGGCAPLFIGSVWAAMMCVVTLIAYSNRDQASAAVLIASVAALWVPALVLLTISVSLGRRRAVIAVVGDTLMILQTGLFRSKRGEWKREQLRSIDVLPSGLKINDEDVLELRIDTVDGRQFSALRHRENHELRMIAGELRSAIEISSRDEAIAKAADGDSSPQADFERTVFRQWEPGRRVHLFAPASSHGALLFVGVLGGLLGAGAGWFAATVVPMAITPELLPQSWIVVGCAAVIGLLAVILLRAATPRRETIFDWSNRIITARVNRNKRTHTFADLDCLVLQEVDGANQSRARLAARLSSGEITLLESESWEPSFKQARRQLAPLARRMAAELGVPVRDRTADKSRHGARDVWKKTPGAAKLVLVLSCITVTAIAALAIGRTWRKSEALATLAQLGVETAHMSGTSVGDEEILADFTHVTFNRAPPKDAHLGEVLANIPRLGITLSKTAISDRSLKPLRGATNILYLDLGNTAITNSGAEILGTMPNLIYLNIASTSIGDEGLAHLAGLRRLRYLSLAVTPITDAAVPSLERLSNLKCLTLGAAPLSEAARARLREALPDAEIDHLGP